MDITPSNIDSVFSVNQLNAYLTFASFGLLVYDYSLTLSTEISEIWASPITGAKLLFLMNRYGVILDFFFQCITFSLITTNVPLCTTLYDLTSVSELITDAGIMGIFSIRTYAIYNQNKIILAILMSLTISRLVLTMLASDFQRSEYLAAPPLSRFGSCWVSLGPSFRIFDLADGVIILAFDTIVLVLTLVKTFRLARESRTKGVGWDISATLLRDGAMYYCCLEVLVLLTICTSLIPGVTFQIPYILTDLQDVMASILTNHLVLNLRRVGHVYSQTQGSTLPELEFATNAVVGNLGASFRPEDEEEDLDDTLRLEWQEQERSESTLREEVP